MSNRWTIKLFLLCVATGLFIATAITQLSCWDMDTNHGATQSFVSYETDNIKTVWKTLHHIL
jgi:hypothetical protein